MIFPIPDRSQGDEFVCQRNMNLSYFHLRPKTTGPRFQGWVGGGMYFGGFLLLMMANTLTAGLGRSTSTSLYSNSSLLNRIESLPSNHSLTITFCRRRVNEGRVRTNVRLVHLMI